MKYAILDVNNVVINIAVADAPLDGSWVNVDSITVSIGDTYSGGVFTSPVTELINYGAKISQLKFLTRIDPEMVAIDLASIDDPSASVEARTMSAELRKFIRKVSAATYIDLSLDEIKDGLAALVLMGLMTAERRSEVLDTPVTEAEAYRK